MPEQMNDLDINKRMENIFSMSSEKAAPQPIKRPLKECKEFKFAHKDGSKMGSKDMQRIIKYFLLRELGSGAQMPMDLIVEAK